jgi:choline kinase
VTDARGVTGVLLAAGRGSRLGAATAERPKCMVELGGQPLLEWQLAALRGAGLERIIAVTGYRREFVESRGLDTVHNSDWERTNMVGSLLCALETLSPPFLVSYSDIVYGPTHVERLLSAAGDLVITYDTAWRDLWEQRFEDPTSDAETFRVDDQGRLLEIGGRVQQIGDVQGQFMGLLKLSSRAVAWIRELVAETPSFRESLDTTALLRELLARRRPVQGVAISGGWSEIDDPHDLEVAERLLARGELETGPEGLV